MIQVRHNQMVILFLKFFVSIECDVIIGSSENDFSLLNLTKLLLFVKKLTIKMKQEDEAMKIENEARSVKKMKNKNNGE